MRNEVEEPVDTIEAYGTFTPPPSECGCPWEEGPLGWAVDHQLECEEK